MNSKARALSIAISIILVALFLGFGIAVSLLAYKYTWNSVVDLEYIPNNISLQFEAQINSNERFVAIAENGLFDNTLWEIPDEETTFTKEKDIVTLSFKFINKSSSRLSIQISGILQDRLSRFSTRAENDNNVGYPLVTQADGTLSINNVILEGGVDNSVEINLIYTLTKKNMSILGTADDAQHLTVNINLL